MVSVLVALAVIGALGTLIGSQAAGLAVDAPRYAEAIEQKIEGAQAFATSPPRVPAARLRRAG